MAGGEAQGSLRLARPRDRQRDLLGLECAARGEPPERAAVPCAQREIAEAHVEAAHRDRRAAPRLQLDPSVVDHRLHHVESDRHRRGHAGGRRSRGGRGTLGLDQHGTRPFEPDAVHGELPGEERQEAVLEDDLVDGEVVAAAGVCPHRPYAAERKAPKDGEVELGGLESHSGGRTGPIEQCAAELRRRELGKDQDDDAQAQSARADEKKTQELARTARHLQSVNAACSMALA